MSFQKGDFFVRFRVFYNKEFTRQKKVTNKLIKSVRCIVIAKRGGGVRSAIWDSVGCVMMWWYIQKDIFLFFDILRKQASYIFPIIPSSSISLFSKNRSDAAGGCPQSFCFFFEYLFSLLQRKKYQCMYYCLILYSYTHCTFQQIDVQAICSK